MKQFMSRFLPPVLWMLAIYAVSSLNTLPGPQTGEVVWWDFILKKTAHMIEYGILFYLWQRALNWNKPEKNKAYFVSAVIVFIFAVSDEYHQSLTPGRNPRFYDVGFDMLGAGLMYLKLRKWI
jgi:VanZ family protein